MRSRSSAQTLPRPAGYSLPSRQSAIRFPSAFPLRSEKLPRRRMVIRRTLRLLLIQKRFERTFLLRASIQHQQHPRHRNAGRRRAAIEFRPSQWIGVAAQNRPIFFIDRGGHKPTLRRGLRSTGAGPGKRRATIRPSSGILISNDGQTPLPEPDREIMFPLYS